MSVFMERLRCRVLGSIFLFGALFQVELAAQPSKFEKVVIAGAKCGNGEPYAVYLRKGRADKIAFEFFGGGACWNARTCFGPAPLAPLSLQGPQENDGIASVKAEESSLFDATYIQFPYCTGDVYAGRHVASYNDRTVFHNGDTNILLSLEQLSQSPGLFEEVTNVYVVGQSAGAVGALSHLPDFDNYFPEQQQKFAVIDSAGLHFGSDFWKKFPKDYFEDIQNRMQNVGLSIVKEEGNVAAQMPAYCDNYTHWKIGFLQTTKDIVMSLVFGNIAQRDHSRVVMSEQGISQLAREKSGNCAVWVQDSDKHTFLGSASKQKTSTNGYTVKEFVTSVLSDSDTPSTIPNKKFGFGLAD